MDERANQYFDDLVDGNTPEQDDDSTLSIDELLELKQIPHQESSFIDSDEYMAPQARPDDTTMLVRLAPFATQDNATKATEQPSIDPDVEATLVTMDNEPFIDPSEYASEEDTPEEDSSAHNLEIGFSFDAADTIPYEDDGEYIPLEVVTAYRNGVAPSSRIVDNTPVGSDQEVGSLNNNMARIVSATAMDVDQVSADMAAELDMVLSRKNNAEPVEEEPAPQEQKQTVTPTLNLDQIFAGEEAPVTEADPTDPSTIQETDPFVTSQSKPAEEIKPAADSLLPAVSGNTSTTVYSDNGPKNTSKKHKAGAIESSKAPNHFGPRTYDPKLEQKPFEYKFEKKKKKKKHGAFREFLSYVFIIAFAWVAAKLLTTYILINATIPSGSMIPTINEGDRIFGFRLAYMNSEPKRGDIIIFPAPDSPEKDYIKRIIGLPGETIEAENGTITITHPDGTKEVLSEPYLPNIPWTALNTFGPYKIPDDGYFCMGDNRNNSNDARAWNNKFVSRDKIKAKALLRYWPFDGFGFVK